jgi:hypothetical protein
MLAHYASHGRELPTAVYSLQQLPTAVYSLQQLPTAVYSRQPLPTAVYSLQQLPTAVLAACSRMSMFYVHGRESRENRDRYDRKPYWRHGAQAA